jgi:malate dehydrogenase (oxaloacetate-decarboxylating)
VGMGAANVATYRILKTAGADPGAVVGCDAKGTLHRGRHDIEANQDDYRDKWRLCQESNAEGVVGGIAEALRGADVCVAFSASGPGVIQPAWVRTMAASAIVFACANPVPEIWPWDAVAAGARIVATGRSDFPNQINNSLGFPGIFRGALDVRARTITDDMAIAAAHELARCAAERGLHEERIVPAMDEWEIAPRVAVATALQAQRQGIARLATSADELLAAATRRVRDARAATDLLMREGLIPAPPRA